MKAFFNFVISRCDLDLRNPCSASLVSKAFKGAKPVSRKIPEKELVDELIYKIPWSIGSEEMLHESQAPIDGEIPDRCFCMLMSNLRWVFVS